MIQRRPGVATQSGYAMTNTTTLRRPGRLFALIQGCYGAFTALGSCGELAVTLAPGSLPDEVLAGLAVLHSSPGVHGWVFAQNLASLPLSLGLLIAAIGLWQRRAWAAAWTRRCALGMLGLLFLAQVVLSVLLYPALLDERLGIPDSQAWLVMLVVAGLAAMVWPVFAWFATAHRSVG